MMLVSTLVYWFRFVNLEYAIPVPVFWVFVLFLETPSTVRGPSWGCFIWYTLVIINVQFNEDGIYLPGLQISYYFEAAIFIRISLPGLISLLDIEE